MGTEVKPTRVEILMKSGNTFDLIVTSFHTERDSSGKLTEVTWERDKNCPIGVIYLNIDEIEAILVDTALVVKVAHWPELHEGDVVWTGYPFIEFGDKPGVRAPIRQVTVCDEPTADQKYVRILVVGPETSFRTEVKRGYLFHTKENCEDFESDGPIGQ